MRTASVAAERWRRLVRLQRGSGLSIAAFCHGKANEHNAWVPRDHWLEAWEKAAILEFERRIRWRVTAAWRS
ncbi:MAG: hypothetical protein KJ057_17360 [Phycisphaerae bacterium]|nr:MAG: hypothetical protein EDS66_16495 [Planctomycetota bacterium]KAB2939918.1 MAG: hypothetical protein F9K17_14545 [Phycisphaerae bacterium]MBE7455122.1 hypothetical protein [Planctomycetia bacterium]MCK6466435.1 hypothetical protein [Phycisphaerae bacterium]MCL4720234.1 hypothetical protein [Phycisphaerae bacterium]